MGWISLSASEWLKVLQWYQNEVLHSSVEELEHSGRPEWIENEWTGIYKLNTQNKKNNELLWTGERRICKLYSEEIMQLLKLSPLTTAAE